VNTTLCTRPEKKLSRISKKTKPRLSQIFKNPMKKRKKKNRL
jgi:hypothetical protein